MNISIIVGNSQMFKYVANEIKINFLDDNIQLIVEDSYSKKNFKKQISFRIKKYGILKFVDEVFYRLFESIFQKKSKIYENYFSNTPDIKIDYLSNNINNEITENLIKSFNPDLIIVFGTSIVKENIFKIAKLGTLNIHPGINPKYKGAGSFWAMKNKDFNNYGFTIHLVDKGIDTGDVVFTKRVAFEKKHKVLSHMYSIFTIEATKELINLLNEIKINGYIKRMNPLTKENNYYTWFGMSDYVIMRWKNRIV